MGLVVGFGSKNLRNYDPIALLLVAVVEAWSNLVSAYNFCLGLITQRNAKWVSGRLEMSIRIDNLSFGHHRQVAPLEPDDQDDWLDRAQ